MPNSAENLVNLSVWGREYKVHSFACENVKAKQNFENSYRSDRGISFKSPLIKFDGILSLIHALPRNIIIWEARNSFLMCSDDKEINTFCRTAD